MTTIAELAVRIAADASSYNKTLDDTSGKTAGWASKLGGLAKGVAIGGVGILATAVGAVGVAALNMEGEFKSATDAIIKGTGASGETLAAMQDQVRGLAKSGAGLGTDMGTIGAALAEVNTRTGATGPALKNLTSDLLTFSRLTGSDAVSNTQLLTRTMGDWGVEMGDARNLLDKIHGAGQAFGIGADSLQGKLVQFGAPLRLMGFSLEQSIAMFGKWEKEGVNAELAIGSLRIAAGKFADEGIDLAQGLKDVQERIKNAATDTEGLSIAMETFGARAGPDMAAAIREGRFELDSAMEALASTAGGLEDAAERTIGFREQWQIGMAQMADSMIPLGVSLASVAEKAMPLLVQGIEWGVGVAVPAIDWLVEQIDKGVEFIQKLFEGPLGDGIGAGVGHFEWVKTWIDENMPLIQQTVETVLGAISAFWDAHGDTIMTVVRNFMTIVETIVDTYLKNIFDLFKIVMQLINGDVEGAGKTLKGIAERTMKAFFTVVSTYLDSIKTVFGDIDWAALGRSIIEGIVAGLKGAGHLLLSAAQGAAMGAVDGIKNMLGIHSPSRVMANEVGVPMVEGIAMGIKDSGKDVIKQAEALIFRTLSAMNMATNVNTQFDNLGDLFTAETLYNALQPVAAGLGRDLAALQSLDLAGISGGRGLASGGNQGSITVNVYATDSRTAGDSVVQALRNAGWNT